MADRDRQFLEYYELGRVTDQLSYYASKAAWHAAKNDHAIVYTGLLMFGAAIASAALAADWAWLGPAWIWSGVATLLPAVSAAVAATRTLYEYERNRDRFENTRLDLQHVQAYQAPSTQLPDEEFRAALEGYVTQVEGLLSREHQQWVQAMEQAELRAPPKPQSIGEAEG